MNSSLILSCIINFLTCTFPLLKQQLRVLPPRVLGRNIPYIKSNNYIKTTSSVLFKLVSHILMFYVDLIIIFFLSYHPGFYPYQNTFLNVARKIRIYSHLYTLVFGYSNRVTLLKVSNPQINNLAANILVGVTGILNIYANYKQTVAIEFLENIFISNFSQHISNLSPEVINFVLRLFANTFYQYILALFSKNSKGPY